MERVPHILIVEDDPAIARMASKFLSDNGLRASTAGDGRSMEKMLAGGAIDLVVLDLMLPGAEDGFALCRRLRAQSHIPVIILSARGEEVDRILGLELGADDYISKPFSPRELLARIRAVMRRSAERFEAAPKIKPGMLVFAGWRLDRQLRQLYDPSGSRVPLTGGEFDLLQALCEHPNRVLTRDQLLDLTQGRSAGPFDRSVDTLVSRIRQKLEIDPKDPQIVKTMRLGGYFFAPEVNAE